MKYSFICVISLSMSFCNSNIDRSKKVDSLIPAEIRQSLIKDHSDIVSHLSGASKITQNYSLVSRWNNEEKSIARNYLVNRIKSMGFDAQELPYHVNLPSHYDMSKHNPYDGVNVFAILPATKPNKELIVIGAHYDTVKETPGASDNATGCALALGVFNIISKIESRNKNLMLVLFDQEETGHAGSYAFVDFINTMDYEIHSVHTFDQLGWDDDGDRNIELELPSPSLEKIYKKNALPYGIDVYKTNVSSSDHREWRDAGYNAIGITEEFKHKDTSPHLHKQSDTFETVNFDYLTFVSYLVSTVIKELILE